jgi:hypothetical protein
VVRCSLSLELGFQRVELDALRAAGSPELVVAVAREIYERGLEVVPRFSRAVEGRSLGDLVETLVDGMETLLREEATGFSLCPLVTERVKFAALPDGQIELVVDFSAALLTFATDLACAATHEDLGILCHAYYDEVFLPFVRRRLVAGVEAARATDLEEVRSEIVRVLTGALGDLRSGFPLHAVQRRYEEAQQRSEVKTGFVFALLAQMREEARRWLGI